jgi:hypothetical protein
MLVTATIASEDASITKCKKHYKHKDRGGGSAAAASAGGAAASAAASRE